MSIDSPNQSTTAAEAPKQSPDYADVRNFLNHTSIGDGLNTNELDGIIADPSKAADAVVASFLKENFDDMRRLSSRGTNEIVSDDLNVYSELLKQAESNVDQGMSADAGLYSMHSRLENRAGLLLPTIGTMIGLGGGGPAGAFLSFAGMLATATAPPVVRKIAMGVGWLAGVAGGGYIGHSVGGIVDRGLKSDGHQQYFNDEAAPAMRRLLQKQYPTDKA